MTKSIINRARSILLPGPSIIHLLSILTLFSAMTAAVRGQSQITFQAFDLTDRTPGQDLWRYDYRVSGVSFEQGQGFSIFFVPSLYASLDTPLAGGSPDWSAIAVQPDGILNDPGYFDGLALRSAPDLTVDFSVTFVWLGVGTPGAQAFDFYNADFSTRFSGQTVLVPEPSVTALFLTGVLGIFALRRERSE